MLHILAILMPPPLLLCVPPLPPLLLRCCRGTEGVLGLYPSPTDERHHPRPGREGQGHAWGQARLPRPLHQFWDVLPEWREVCGEVQRLLV